MDSPIGCESVLDCRFVYLDTHWHMCPEIYVWFLVSLAHALGLTSYQS